MAQENAAQENPASPNPPPKKPNWRGVSSGAAFLMAVSAIGPGFLTQTTQFTATLGASLAFAILVSIAIDIGAQLNTWRILCVSGQRGQELGNNLAPGLGWFVAGVIVLGSFIFNIGNLNGCAQGLLVLTELPLEWGAVLSALVGVVLFLLPRMLKSMDLFSKVLGVGMIVLTLYILFAQPPPFGEALLNAVAPEYLDEVTIVTLVGGTIGGYIMFSGAHRLLDAGVRGKENLSIITVASVQGILITGVMRIVLFLAVLGVASQLTPTSTVFDAFQLGAGATGLILSGLIFWFAAITSVVGCSYTAITFLIPKEAPSRGRWIVLFILLSLAATLALGVQPRQILVLAGTLNGILLPILLGVIMLGAHSRKIMGDYKHPVWAICIGWAAWLATLYLAYVSAALLLGKLLNDRA